MRSVHCMFLAAVAAIALAAIPACAGCDLSITTTASSSYLYQDFGKVAPGSSGGLAVMPLAACPLGNGDTLLLDVWNRFDPGGYRANNSGNETDVELAYDAPLGWFDVELYAGYYDLAPQPLHHGAVEFYADLGHSFDLGWAKVKLALRPIQIVGINDIPNFTLVRLRAPLTLSLEGITPGLSTTIEPSVVYNFTPQPGQPEISWRPTASLDYDLNERHRVSLDGKEANSHFAAELAWRIKLN